MFRHCTAFLVGLCLAGPLQAATWADAMFEELSKDFGSVPRGPTLSHPFRLTNNTKAPVHISGIRVSCGCVTAVAQSGLIPPGQSTVISVSMDTQRFSGVKTVTIYVHLDQPQSEEVRIWVQANSRDDVTVTPDAIHFGQVKRSACPSGTVTVTFLGGGQWQVTGTHCDSNYVKPVLKEVTRGGAEVSYQLTATLRNDAPAGKWFTDIWLKTNNPMTPRIRVPLTVEIESALTVSPAIVDLGSVKVGAQTERRVIVRGVRPFKITDVHGADAQLKVRDTTPDNKPLHVLAVTLQGDKPGDMTRSLRILTDLKDESEIEFVAKAQIVP
ncbi:MAG: DUF1573 domain-containing protein [Gemmataceae bacterium]|nr:DUF1573 domain-containing protein [Gemmataceae bacterium]